MEDKVSFRCATCVRNCRPKRVKLISGPGESPQVSYFCSRCFKTNKRSLHESTLRELEKLGIKVHTSTRPPLFKRLLRRSTPAEIQVDIKDKPSRRTPMLKGRNSDRKAMEEYEKQFNEDLHSKALRLCVVLETEERRG